MESRSVLFVELAHVRNLVPVHMSDIARLSADGDGLLVESHPVRIRGLEIEGR